MKTLFALACGLCIGFEIGRYVEMRKVKKSFSNLNDIFRSIGGVRVVGIPSRQGCECQGEEPPN